MLKTNQAMKRNLLKNLWNKQLTYQSMVIQIEKLIKKLLILEIKKNLRENILKLLALPFIFPYKLMVLVLDKLKIN